MNGDLEDFAVAVEMRSIASGLFRLVELCMLVAILWRVW